MAADWIKVRVDLQTHPKVVRILSATRADKFRVIGGLHAVWSVFDAHSEDGVLRGYTPELLDHVIGWEGFSRAMEAVGWLTFDGLETLSLPEFTAHNGKSAKARAEDQKRKRDERRASESRPIPVRNLSEENRTREREEKRREDQEQGALRTPSAPADAVAALDSGAKSGARGTKLPEGWEPSEAMTVWARNERPDLILSDTLARFRDYWRAQPGAKGRKADWPATWRNWVRNEKRQPGDVRGAAAERAPVTHDAIATQRRLVAESEARARKEWEAKQAAGGAP